MNFNEPAAKFLLSGVGFLSFKLNVVMCLKQKIKCVCGKKIIFSLQGRVTCLLFFFLLKKNKVYVCEVFLLYYLNVCVCVGGGGLITECSLQQCHRM